MNPTGATPTILMVRVVLEMLIMARTLEMRVQCRILLGLPIFGQNAFMLVLLMMRLAPATPWPRGGFPLLVTI